MRNFLYSQRVSPFILAIALLATACTPKHYTQTMGDSLSLYLKSPSSSEVLFASSIDQYQYHYAKKLKGDVWEVVITPQEEFEYFYIVDGAVTIPDCEITVRDDFGEKNCLFVFRM